jgi:hypothetical protein
MHEKQSVRRWTPPVRGLAIDHMLKLRRCLAGLLVAIAVVAATVVNAQPASASTPIPEEYYILHWDPVNTRKCLDVEPDETTGSIFLNGTRVWQNECVVTDHMIWVVVRIGRSDRFHIRNLETQLCLDLRDGDTGDGAVIQQWACNSTSTTMMWRFEDAQVSNFFPTAKVVNVRSRKCLDVTDNSPDDFAMLQSVTCSPNHQFNTAQYFEFRR